MILNYKASERTPDVDILVDANLAFINDLSSECRPVESLITLKVHGKSRVSAAGRFEESFSVSIYDRLKLIYDRLPEGSVLRFDGDKLPPQLTIHEAGLEDGDMLELF